eukprot:Skav218688  [mRNA]  locus=scaffold4775:45874:47238:+ [translate_table: standard]
MSFIVAKVAVSLAVGLGLVVFLFDSDLKLRLEGINTGGLKGGKARRASSATPEIMVFVHGLGGWGTLDGLHAIFPYFNQNFQKEYEDKGYKFHIASVGPVSSNWDRACQLYAQIKGLRVDFGIAHSDKYGHKRFGKDFTGKGFYPEWSPENRIHLMGHSMGGQTIRMLEQMLQEGVPEEVEAYEKAVAAGDSPPALSPLFTQATGNYIKSLSGVASPFDGTPVLDMAGADFVGFVKDLILDFTKMTTDSAFEQLYDLDLEQFGFKRLPGEKLGDMLERFQAAPISQRSFQDLATYDLSPEGAVAIQKGKQGYSGTYYFALAAERTDAACKWLMGTCEYQVPAMDMNPIMHVFSYMLGGSLQPDPSLRANDGVVPQKLAECPYMAYENGRRNCIPLDQANGQFQTGVWYYQDTERDHMQIIGQAAECHLPITGQYVCSNRQKLYRGHADILAGLI